MSNRISRIQKLDDQLANQIAAGEVVERPGSALKELMENSLDAGAKYIRVSLRDGGTSLLEVADDGHGIHSQDLLLALDRHATSKIRRTEDLFAIDSWGFRGEALASIAAVSRLTISSRASEESVGREIVCEGGIIREDRTVARSVGTTVRVEDLFFNTPARKKFQKSAGAESAFCGQVFHRLALGSPECAFELLTNGEKQLHYAPATRMENRVAEVYRSAWRLDLDESEILQVEAASGSSPMKLRAWILPSKHFIPSSRGILLYVNRRSVKDKLLQQSVLTAAKETLFGSLYPQLVLMLETEASGVDVNVHPAKSEVRFRDSGHVFAFVRKHIEQALAGDRRGSVELPVFQASPDVSAPTLFASTANYHQKAAEARFAAPVWGEAPSPSEASCANSSAEIPPAYTGPQFLGTLKNTYLLCQDENGLLLVDQHAAHERVTYERLKRARFERAEGAPLLIPIQVELGREALDRLETEFPRFAEHGLELDRTGPTLLAVRELPALLLRRDGTPAVSIGNLLRKLVQGWEEMSVEGELAEVFREKLLDVLASESCHGSVRAGQSLSPHEAMALLTQMSDTDFSGHCPHGRPTTVRFRWSEIERLFKRVF